MADIFDLCLGAEAANLNRVDLSSLEDPYNRIPTTRTLSDGVEREALTVKYACDLFRKNDHDFKAGETYTIYVISEKNDGFGLYMFQNGELQGCGSDTEESITSEYLPNEISINKYVINIDKDCTSNFYLCNDDMPVDGNVLGLAYIYRNSPLYERLTTIANNIRAKTGDTEKLSLDQMAEGVNKVFDAGQEEGYEHGYGHGYAKGHTAGYEEGKSEGGYEDGYEAGHGDGYDAGYEQGKAEGGGGGGDPTENPFYYSKSLTGTFNSVVFPENSNLVFNFHQAPATMTNFLSYAKNIISVTLISENRSSGAINISGIVAAKSTTATLKSISFEEFESLFKNISNAFYGQENLVDIIGEIDLSECTHPTSAFYQCSSLANIAFKPNSIIVPLDFSYCKSLTKASATSIMVGLSNEIEGKTLTISTTAIDKAFETTVGAANGSTSEAWLALVAAKPNWNIVMQDN